MKYGKSVLVVDGGGRGAALVHKYAQSKYVTRVLAVPGNDLMQLATHKEVITHKHLKTTSIEEILAICKKEHVDLIDVAHDNAVEVGLADELRKNGFYVVGPSRDAGQIEWDKAFARALLKKTRAPQPLFYVFHNPSDGIAFLKNQKESRWFVKASGLAEGKGALAAESNEEAIGRIKELKKFGRAADLFLIEQWLIGEEFSAFTLCDGKNFQFLGTAQDYKRVFTGDFGENTGGMGCTSPSLAMTKPILSQVYEIFGDTLEQLSKMGRPYQGVLYLGGMIVEEKDGPKVYVIEFNARWGDPEVQVILQGIKNDWFEVSMATATQTLNKIKVRTDNKYRIVVAGASRGYPGDYSRVKGKRIYGLSDAQKIDGVTIYGAGIERQGGKYYASGGRLFHVVSTGKNIVEARRLAYSAMSLIYIEGNNLHYRTDIGWRDLERLFRN